MEFTPPSDMYVKRGLHGDPYLMIKLRSNMRSKDTWACFNINNGETGNPTYNMLDHDCDAGVIIDMLPIMQKVFKEKL